MATYPTTRLDREVDRNIRAVNDAFLADPEAVQAALDDGERWRRITEAEDALGPHGVVLPTALVQALADTLDDKPVTISRGTLRSMLLAHMGQAERRT